MTEWAVCVRPSMTRIGCALCIFDSRSKILTSRIACMKTDASIEADTCTPRMAPAAAEKLMNKVNLGDTGLMHGMLPIHVGMRVRLLDHIDKAKALVKDAEGDVVRVEINPADADEVDSARREGRPAYLRHLPFGIWLSMAKYEGAPFVKRLQKLTDGISPQDARSLVFVEPKPSSQFCFSTKVEPVGKVTFSVVRTGFVLSHGRVITSTACQGKTLHDGVIIDAGRRLGGQNPTREDDFWLHLYVMLSRATDLDNILLTRAPPVEFLLQGPPESLARTLRTFAARTNSCGLEARRLAAELGLQDLLRD